MLATSAWSLLVLTLALTNSVSGHPNGADTRSCVNLDPRLGHGASTATGPAPYNLTFSKSSYVPNESIQVTLGGTGGAQFKGFLIEARRAEGTSTAPIGSFTPQDPTQAKTMCDGSLGNGVTHTSNSVKSSIIFNWKAPAQAQGNVRFHFTVVRGGAPSTTSNAADYFKNLQSDVVTGPAPVPEDV